MRIKILKPFIGRVDGKSIPFKEGDEVDIPDEDAVHMVRGRYAEIVNVPGVKIKHKPAISKSVK